MADTNPVVSALTTYIENAEFPIVGAIQFNPEMTAAETTIQSGVKGSTKMHFLSTDVNFLAGAGCDRATPTDATTFADKTLTVAQIAIAENWCLEQLRNKYTQIFLKKGTITGKQVAPDEVMSVYWDEKKILLAQALDAADWQGDTSSLTANLNKYDGWIKFIDAGAAVNGNTGLITGVAGITQSNVIAAFQAMYLNIPVNIQSKTDLVLNVPMEWKRLYDVALINANLFNFPGKEGETMLFGTNIKLKGRYGLNGTNRMFLTYMTNLVTGVDGENDTEFTSRLDPTSLKRLFVDCEFTRGHQVQFVEDVVEFTYAAS